MRSLIKARLRCASARQPSLFTSLKAKAGGADRVRTCDPHNAIVVLYQLSYDPIQSAAQSKVFAALVKAFFHFQRRKFNFKIQL